MCTQCQMAALNPDESLELDSQWGLPSFGSLFLIDQTLLLAIIRYPPALLPTHCKLSVMQGDTGRGSTHIVLRSSAGQIRQQLD